METKLRRQLLVGRVQDRLVLRIPPQRDRLRVASLVTTHGTPPRSTTQAIRQRSKVSLCTSWVKRTHMYRLYLSRAAKKERVCPISAGLLNRIWRCSPQSICKSSPGNPANRTTAIAGSVCRALRSGRTKW